MIYRIEGVGGFPTISSQGYDSLVIRDLLVVVCIGGGGLCTVVKHLSGLGWDPVEIMFVAYPFFFSPNLRLDVSFFCFQSLIFYR